MNRREFLTILALAGAQTLIPLPNLNGRFWNALSRTQGFYKHEKNFESLEVPTGIRLLLFSPHPDDETLAAGGLIQRVTENEGKARVVFMTNGDGYAEGVRIYYRNVKATPGTYVDYGIKRHNEAVHAIGELGLQPEDGIFLGFPDQGIDSLWRSYWSRLKPYRSPYTQYDRPNYRTSVDKWAKYSGTDLDEELRRLILQFDPDWIVFPDPRDFHPDHSATGVFVLDALRRLYEDDESEVADVETLTYLVHYPEYPISNRWTGLLENDRFKGPEAISKILTDVEWSAFSLNADEVSKKTRSLGKYVTQLEVLGSFIRQFIRPFEIFGSFDIEEFVARSRTRTNDFVHGRSIG